MHYRDGSFEISETITKEHDNTSSKDLVEKAQSYVTSDKVKPENSESIFKTAIMLGFLRTTSPSSDLSEKFKQARAYLSSQIGDAKLEEDIIKVSSKVVIDKGSEKVVKESKKEALKDEKLIVKEKADQAVVEKVQESVTEEECEKVIKTQTYTNKVLGKHKSKTTESNKKALAWLHEQVKDEKLEKEILESCEKLVVEKVFLFSWAEAKEKKKAAIITYDYDDDEEDARYITQTYNFSLEGLKL
ncbi:hypothetical protein C1645_806724 [Glomus cerebriforme]|uniref:Uncharacterized protein n=1 Tax=Glomus cerebriforme TaxID=658196 RepID=A0A397SQY0_9GLOM|nr:hypothetical protein C1645_806724 [Glomus cerebriforme]